MDGDTSPLNVVARALARLQHVYGVIPNVKSKGAASRKVLQKLLHLRREEEGAHAVGSSQQQQQQGGPLLLSMRGEIDTLVV